MRLHPIIFVCEQLGNVPFAIGIVAQLMVKPCGMVDINDLWTRLVLGPTPYIGEEPTIVDTGKMQWTRPDWRLEVALRGLSMVGKHYKSFGVGGDCVVVLPVCGVFCP